MITADQLVAHAIGDYILQSDWMANEKTKQDTAAAVHAVVYTSVFLFLTRDIGALSIILWTHFFIDRYRLARYVVFVKNFLAPQTTWPTWADCTGTGYPSSRPPFLAVWLLIIADNILHVLINGGALWMTR
jgi:hypothetical protein